MRALQSMLEIDAFFRPAAVTLALLTAFLLLRDARFDFRARLGALFGIGTAAYMFCAGAAGVWSASSLLLPLCIGNSVFFWWFALALLEDDFRLEAVHVGVLIAVLALGFARVRARMIEHAALGQALAVVHNLIILALDAHVLLLAWRGYDNDLLESRRRFRLLFLIGGSLVAIGIAIVEATLAGRPPAAWMLALQSVLVSILAASAAAWLFRTSAARLAFQSTTGAKQTESAPGLERRKAVDEALGVALERAMTIERLYLEQGLTIAAVAKRLGAPEHRLRKHINEALGHSNFNTYVNQQRIDAAKAALRDPKLAHVPVLTIALDSGFASLPPFNRAFRANTGQSATAYRSAALAARSVDGPIESEKS
jgi:AraC-like DNA-binding protein